MSTIQYIALDGERWDSIAYKAYGDQFNIQPLIDANPNIPIMDRLAAGTVVEIPVFEEEDLPVDQTDLPPWKQ